MSLDYDFAFHSHSSLTLRCGRKIILDSLRQKLTYGQMVGTPMALWNDGILEGVVAEARERGAHPERIPFLIPPVRRPYLREPGDSRRVWRDRETEWLPMVYCVASFISSSPAGTDPEMDHSCLDVIWFQDDYAMPIAPEALEVMKSLDWAAHAVDYRY